MAGYFAAASLAVSVIGTGVSMAMQGQAAQAAGAAGKAAAIARAQALEYDAAQQEELILEAQTQAHQQGAQRLQQLMSLTGSNYASAVTQGVGTDSASFDAINKANLTGAATDLGNIAYMGAQRVDRARSQREQDLAGAKALYAGGEAAVGMAGMKEAGAYAMGGWNIAQNFSSQRIGDWFNSMGRHSGAPGAPPAAINYGGGSSSQGYF